MTKRNRPSWWIPAKHFRRLQECVRAAILRTLRDRGEVMAGLLVSDLVDRVPGVPDYQYGLSAERVRACVWRMIDALDAEHLIERYTPRNRGSLLHLRLVNPLDRVAYALAEVHDDATGDDDQAGAHRP